MSTEKIIPKDERVTEENKSARFNEDLSIALNSVRACLDHWGLQDWREYLVVRKPGQAGAYVIMANPTDETGFDERILELHKATAEQEQQ